MELRYCLNQGILERISKILGDTSNGLTGSEIDSIGMDVPPVSL